MNKIKVIILIFIFVNCILVEDLSSANDEYLSPSEIVINKDNGMIYITSATSDQIVIYDSKKKMVIENIVLPTKPGGLIFSPDLQKLYVTSASSNGKVFVIDPVEKKIIKDFPVGHTPVSPVVSHDGNILFVCNRFDNNVSVVDLNSSQEIMLIEVGREPIGAVITPDGNRLLVINLLADGKISNGYIAATISIINTKSYEVENSIRLPNGSTGLRGICLSPDGAYAYITHIIGRYQYPTTQITRGWINTNALSIIDVNSQKLHNTVLLDDIDNGAANPWDVKCGEDGRYLYVSYSGTNEVSQIDRQGLHERLNKIHDGEKVSGVSFTSADIPNDLSFMNGLIKRFQLSGMGPRDIALHKHNIYIAEYFSGSLSKIEINSEEYSPIELISLEPQKLLPLERKGEMLFHDARICFQQWQSCASCHPDARSDGLNWDLLNDGIGNPKQTKSLLLAHETPPAMITGIRPNAEAAVRNGIKYIHFSVQSEDVASAIDEYLKSLVAVPSPYGSTDKAKESADRGKSLFRKAGCAECHNGNSFTDLQKYNVGTGIGREENYLYDTPTLIEIWRTAPYLNDGRALTIKDVLKKYNANDHHGVTSEMTDQEIEDLVIYILSL